VITNDQKLRNIAVRVSESSTVFMQALNDLIEMGIHASQSGLEFTNVDYSDVPELQHLDATVITACFTSAEATRDWLQSSFNSTNFQKARAR